MATEDEPLDDLRAVGMTAGVTAARVVETLAKDAQQRAQQQREAVAVQWQAASEVALALAQQPPTSAADRTRTAPDKPAQGTKGAEMAQSSQSPSYDSPERRQSADQTMRAAGVPDEARQAHNVSDLMNGTDPALAASSGRTIKAATKPQTKAPTRERTR